MLVVKPPACQWRRYKRYMFIPGLGKTPGGRNGNPLQESCLENPTERGAWLATVHRVEKSQTWLKWLQFSSVTQLCSTPYDSMDCSKPGFPVHDQLPEFTQTHVHWVSDAIQPFYPVFPFSSHLQSFPASGSFQMSQFFASHGQSIRVSVLASVLPMNIQGRFPLGWTGWISLLFKGLSRVFFNTRVQKHQFFGAQISL